MIQSSEGIHSPSRYNLRLDALSLGHLQGLTVYLLNGSFHAQYLRFWLFNSLQESRCIIKIFYKVRRLYVNILVSQLVKVYANA